MGPVAVVPRHVESKLTEQSIAPQRDLDPARNSVEAGVPEISRFSGIVIAMFYNDHSPPHSPRALR